MPAMPALTPATDVTPTVCTVENGAFTSVPVYQGHRRGRNWLAVIGNDPAAPGGIARQFQKAANGRYFYMVKGLAIGQAVEFGADYYSGAGTKRPERWYGVVIAISEDAITLAGYGTSARAIKAAKELSAGLS